MCKQFTEEEKNIIRKHYPDIGTVGVAKLLNGRSRDVIKQWAHKNGVKVSHECKSKIATVINLKYKPHMSEETKKKIGDGHRKYETFRCKICGKKIAHYANLCWNCYVQDVRGQKNNNWRGGVTTLINIVGQMLYPVWKYPILARDKFQCQNCGATGYLEIHHLRRYVEIRDEVIGKYPDISLDDFDGRKKIAQLIVLEHSLDDGITLCKKCHKSIHRKKRGELKVAQSAIGNIRPDNAEDNPQPNSQNVIPFVCEEVQRLTLEDTQTNKSDTSAPLLKNLSR